jgi:ribose transport system ATP-binding protein
LARAILGIDKMSSGKIYLDNKPVAITSPIQAKKRGIVMIPEERKSEGLVLSLDIENNISLPYLNSMSTFSVVSDKKAAVNSENIAIKVNI